LRIAGSPAANAPEADLDEICALVSKFNKDHPQLEPFDLTKLLADCQVVRRVVKPIGETDQSGIELIRARAQERRYQQMISKGQGGSLPSFSSEIKTLTQTAHFFSCFIGAFLCGFFASRIFLDCSIHHAAAAGGASAIVTLLLETSLLILRENSREISKNK